MSKFVIHLTDAATQQTRRLGVSWFPNKADFDAFLQLVQDEFGKVPKYFTYTDDEWESCRLESPYEFIELVNSCRIQEKAFIEMEFVGFEVKEDEDDWTPPDNIVDEFVPSSSGPVGMGPSTAVKLAQFREQMMTEISDRRTAEQEAHRLSQCEFGGIDAPAAINHHMQLRQQHEQKKKVEQDLRNQLRAYRRAFSKRAPEYSRPGPGFSDSPDPVTVSLHNAEHKEEGSAEVEEGALPITEDEDSESGDLHPTKVIRSDLSRFRIPLFVALRLRGPTFNPFHCGMCAASQEDEMVLWKCLTCNVALCCTCEPTHDPDHVITKGFANRSYMIKPACNQPKPKPNAKAMFKAKPNNPKARRYKRLKYMYNDDQLHERIRQQRPAKQVESNSVRMSDVEKGLLLRYGRAKYDRYRAAARNISEMGLDFVNLDTVFSLMDQTNSEARVVELLLSE